MKTEHRTIEKQWIDERWRVIKLKKEAIKALKDEKELKRIEPPWEENTKRDVNINKNGGKRDKSHKNKKTGTEIHEQRKKKKENRKRRIAVQDWEQYFMKLLKGNEENKKAKKRKTIRHRQKQHKLH